MTTNPTTQRDELGGPTNLYRAYDANGQLLYIGVARVWANRWAHHAERSPFYPATVRLHIDTHPTRTAALTAERDAIQSERPAFNIKHNGTEHPRQTKQSNNNPPDGCKTWTFQSTRQNFQQTIPLWLNYEIDLSACLCDADDDDDPVEYFAKYLKYKKRIGVQPVCWSVQGPCFAEIAPFAPSDLWNLDDFLTHFTWPINKDGPLNWFTLPVVCRFPDLETGLQWKPSPLQQTIDIDAVLKSLGVNPTYLRPTR